MCLLFLSLDENPTPRRYPVVIANNRDELWDRPTKLADFWPSHQDCISGLDEEPGKEGGTWLGLSKTGHFASLLNILSSQNDPNKKGRGHLVTNCLTSSNDQQSYLRSVFSEADQYNGFNLVALHIRAGWKYTLTFLSSWTQYYDKLLDITPQGYHGFGNCRHKPAWKKVEVGKAAFKKIVEANGTTDKKEKLLEELFQLLSDKSKHLPDEQLDNEGKNLPEDLRQQLAAINVWSPANRYGTRTMTVILIDSDGNAEYIEKTLKTPVEAESIQWITSRHSFKMQLDS
ncbi:transport and Golgi organization protein 2 homolog [Liolophura sinensis]|uniref:transport and Golgi organization protein 2 homolog n=1 Tax=Liolophura sinensis TaxID=3198878 RepID=UPI0031581167